MNDHHHKDGKGGVEGVNVLKKVTVVLYHVGHRVDVVAVAVAPTVSAMIHCEHFKTSRSEDIRKGNVASRVFTDTVTEKKETLRLNEGEEQTFGDSHFQWL